MVAHAGSAATRLLADRVGLTDQVSTAMARRSFVPVHDRGRVLVDVAVMPTDGGEAISDIDVLRHCLVSAKPTSRLAPPMAQGVPSRIVHRLYPPVALHNVRHDLTHPLTCLNASSAGSVRIILTRAKALFTPSQDPANGAKNRRR